MASGITHGMIGAPSYGPAYAARHRLGQPEIDFARKKRALGASWAGIAGMLNCSEPDIRALADNAWPIPAKPAAAVQRDPTDVTGLLGDKFRLTRAETALLFAMLHPPGRPLQRLELSSKAPAHIAAIRTKLARRDLYDVVEHVRGGWLISRSNARRILFALGENR